MGQNLERLGRLRGNQTSLAVTVVRGVQMTQRVAAASAIETASEGVQKAARTEGFEGSLGDKIREKLLKIHTDIEAFTEYRVKLDKAITLANEALSATATSASGLPPAGLTPAQQNTIDMATKTESPVQVAPGVTMTPAQAAQHYQEQADFALEEDARRLTAALDTRLLEIIGALPVSDYDERPGSTDENKYGGGGGGPTADGPGGGGPGAYDGPGVVGPGDDGGYDGPGVVGPTNPDPNNPNNPNLNNPNLNDPNNPDLNGSGNPPSYVWPPRTPVEPPYRPPGIDPAPNIDGDGNGWVPGTPPPGGTRLPPPGGFGPGGFGPGGPGGIGPGGIGPGGIGGGLAGGVVGGAGRLGAAARLGAAGGIGVAGGIGGAVGGAGASGVAGVGGAGGAGAAGGAGGAGRGGMIAGGGAQGGAGGKAGRKNRRRGQDLQAYELDDEGEDVSADLGSAGAAGSSESDGREELGW